MRPPLDQLTERYGDRLFAIAFSITKNPMYAEDIVQETFLKYHTSNKDFESDDHLRHWLCRVAVNKAKNLNLSAWRRKSVPLEEYASTLSFETPEESELFSCVLKMQQKYRTVIHLYYYEDYSVKEIANILGLRENTVKQRLYRGRKFLKENLEEGWDYE